MNESTTNHAAKVERNHVWNGAAPMPYVPGMVNIAEIFGVPLKTLEDIYILSKGIELVGRVPQVWLILARWEAWLRILKTFPIILKKWSMNTRLCKEELTRILVWVKIHDVPIQVFSEDGLSIIVSQIDDVLNESLTMGVPLIEGSGFIIETVNIEYEPKATADVPNKGATKKNLPLKASVPPTKEGNITVSNSYVALDDESEEEVENVYDESANLLNSTKTGESSSTFTVAAG
ncbi:zinc knuckle CX2CX4HX4C containing protein [Tanacetum coccineum]